MGIADDAYRALFAPHSRPTDDDVLRFALHLSDDHSWDKKLPLEGAGEPFFLYLNPERAQHALWAYWNWGPPDQSPDEAVASAASTLRVRSGQSDDVPVPEAVLRLGLVYLRGTLAPMFDADEWRYRGLEVPAGWTHGEDRSRQIADIENAMRRVRGWVFDNALPPGWQHPT